MKNKAPKREKRVDTFEILKIRKLYDSYKHQKLGLASPMMSWRGIRVLHRMLDFKNYKQVIIKKIIEVSKGF